MAAICIYFKFHHSIPVQPYHFFEIGKHQEYFDFDSSRENLKRLVNESFLPAIDLLDQLGMMHKKNFRAGLSLSGVLIDQLEKWHPKVLSSLQDLVKQGHLELLAEPWYYSLSFLYDRAEFVRQIEMHELKIQELFGQKPGVLINSALIYNNFLAYFLDQRAYKGIITEGAWNILKGRSSNYLYAAIDGANPGLLLRNSQLSEDLSIRFHDPNWDLYPLGASTWISWLKELQGDLITLGFSVQDLFPMGENVQPIVNFWNAWTDQALQNELGFLSPSEAIASLEPKEKLSCDEYISSEMQHRDNAAWLGTEMQKEYLENLYSLKEEVLATEDTKLIEKWSLLQQADLIFCPQSELSPGVSEIYLNLMNLLADLRLGLTNKNNIKF